MAWDPASARDPDGIDLHRAVIEAVSDAEEVRPEDLEQQLYEAVDPDALNALFAGREPDTARIVFRYHGYDVTIRRGSSVTLDARES